MGAGPLHHLAVMWQVAQAGDCCLYRATAACFRAFILQVMLGDRIAQHMRVFAGDCVPKKKPSPDIYNLAAQVGCAVVWYAVLQCASLCCALRKPFPRYLQPGGTAVCVGSRWPWCTGCPVCVKLLREGKCFAMEPYSPTLKCCTCHLTTPSLGAPPAASQELGVNPARCVVIEDSRIGLAAAKAAGMRCAPPSRLACLAVEGCT